MSTTVSNLIGYVAVAICWGGTTPFMRASLDHLPSPSISAIWNKKTWAYIIPLMINLSGSTVYYSMLRNVPLRLFLDFKKLVWLFL
jgi:hypothetical protein